jgi:hypothetical protein
MGVQRVGYYGFILFIPAVLVCCAVLVVLLVVPIQGGAGSWGGMSLFGIVLLAALFFGVRGWAYWRRPWLYEIGDRHLAVERLFGHRRDEIPWADIVRVRKALRRDRLRNWPETEVETCDGKVLLIPTNFSEYEHLIDVIRSRAAKCQEFDAYPAWRFGMKS